jgi:outer membrane protein OmpA-like peptidoglycan-associated protein
MSTSANDSSLYKLFMWLLLAALIGVYALYSWHQGNLAADLAAERKEVAAATDRLSEAQERIEALQDSEQGLKDEIARLASAAAVKAEESAAALDAANSQVQGLRAKLDESAAKVTAASGRIQALVTELEQARGAADSLSSRLEAAEQTESTLRAELADAAERMNGLGTRIAELEQALAEADADAASKIQAVREELDERIERYRVQLEGDEPERAAWIAGLEEEAASVRAERDTLVAQAARQAERAAQEADAAAQALAEAKDTNAELQAQVAELNQGLASQRSAVSALEQALDQASGKLQASNAELEQMKTDAEAAAKALADAQAANAQGSERIAALEAELGSERDTGARLKAQLDSTLARAAEEKQSLEQRIAEQDQALEQARADTVAIETAMTEMRALYDRFSTLGGVKTERGLLLSIDDELLRFQSGLAILPRGELPSLDRIAALLADYPGLTARIEGHTDSAGPEDINLNLSKARADAVRDALIDRGVAEERLVAEGIGEARPVADNASAEGRRANRRVEIYILQ